MWDVKYRPQRFSEVLGQDGTVRVLKARLAAGTALSTSYMFAGGHGQGKTTLARILARAVLCQDLQPDGEPCNVCDNCKDVLSESTLAFSELDAASRGTIDNIRSIVDDLPFVIPGAPTRVYLFDEAHRMSRDAQDVLLKPLEDKKMVGIFCTTEPEKIRGAIKSRCEAYTIRKVTREEILARMRWVTDQEGVKAEEDALLIVIDQSGGHVRDILNCLEMVAQMGPITVDAVREYLKTATVSLYYEILLSLGEPAKAILLAEQAIDQVGVDSVVAGLAEAAMNSFRLAHGMFADFTFVDRERAQKVHAMYGSKAVQLAEFFLGGSRPTRVGLICVLLACTGGTPALRSTGAAMAAPVVVTPVAAQPAVVVAPVAAQPAVQPAVGAAPVAPSVGALAPVPIVEVPRSSSQKGNLGSGDPEALTDLDTEAIGGMPRGARPRTTAVSLVKKGSKDKAQFIPATQFRREFMLAWLDSRGITKGGVKG